MNSTQADYGKYSKPAIHFHITGALSASMMPWWMNWFRSINPGTKCFASVSQMAARFVSIEAIRAILNADVWIDSWNSDSLPKYWREGGPEKDCSIVVAPASIDTVMKISQGRTETPALMMLQLSALPIVIADSMPGTNEIIEDYRGRLSARSNVMFTDRVSAFASIDRSRHASGFNFPDAISKANLTKPT